MKKLKSFFLRMASLEHAVLQWLGAVATPEHAKELKSAIEVAGPYLAEAVILVSKYAAGTLSWSDLGALVVKELSAKYGDETVDVLKDAVQLAISTYKVGRAA